MTIIKPITKRHPRWAAVARNHLLLQPRCAACGAKEHLVVHHIVPVHVDAARELVPENLITLCEGPTLNCHLWCGHLGHWRSWNENVIRDAAWFRDRVRNRPWK